MTNHRPPPPPLEMQYPLCPLCGNEVNLDDGQFDCADCAASWPAGAESIGCDSGRWLGFDEPQCESIDGRFLPGGRFALKRPDDELVRCLLSAGHATWIHKFGSVGRSRAWANADSATEAQLSQREIEVSA